MDITEKISDLEKANKKMSALGASEVFRLNEKLNLRLLPNYFLYRCFYGLYLYRLWKVTGAVNVQ